MKEISSKTLGCKRIPTEARIRLYKIYYCSELMITLETVGLIARLAAEKGHEV